MTPVAPSPWISACRRWIDHGLAPSRGELDQARADPFALLFAAREAGWLSALAYGADYKPTAPASPMMLAASRADRLAAWLADPKPADLSALGA